MCDEWVLCAHSRERERDGNAGGKGHHREGERRTEQLWTRLQTYALMNAITVTISVVVFHPLPLFVSPTHKHTTLPESIAANSWSYEGRRYWVTVWHERQNEAGANPSALMILDDYTALPHSCPPLPPMPRHCVLQSILGRNSWEWPLAALGMKTCAANQNVRKRQHSPFVQFVISSGTSKPAAECGNDEKQETSTATKQSCCLLYWI